MQSIKGVSQFKWPRESVGDIDADTAARLLAASSDVAIVIDREGTIRDVAVSNSDLLLDGFSDVIERRWVDTVAVESRRKVEEMLREASAGRDWRWREVNQLSARGSIPLKYVALNAGPEGHVIALGRDLRSVASLQQRLLQAQQTMERDYVRLRQAEARYRVLFQIASEAVLIVDQDTKKVVEANPAAGNLLGVVHTSLHGQSFGKLFHAEARDAAVALLADGHSGAQSEPVRVRLADGRNDYVASASLFRQDGIAHVLVRLSSVLTSAPAADSETKQRLLQVLNRIPDAFVVTDDALNIVDCNIAFLELTQIATLETARGLPLGRFVGRPGVDLTVLSANLREHGWVRNFGTIVNSVYSVEEQVELSAVTVRVGLEVFNGFVIRASKRDFAQPTEERHELPRTAEQLTQLVGRVSLREIVGETTDVIERMCIEAALNLTGNNRASAAEILGLSRQSLYSKLNRFGLGNYETDASDDN